MRKRCKEKALFVRCVLRHTLSKVEYLAPLKKWYIEKLMDRASEELIDGDGETASGQPNFLNTAGRRRSSQLSCLHKVWHPS
jgi:hypothetical protein